MTDQHVSIQAAAKVPLARTPMGLALRAAIPPATFLPSYGRPSNFRLKRRSPDRCTRLPNERPCGGVAR